MPRYFYEYSQYGFFGWKNKKSIYLDTLLIIAVNGKIVKKKNDSMKNYRVVPEVKIQKQNGHYYKDYKNQVCKVLCEELTTSKFAHICPYFLLRKLYLETL